MTAPLFLTRKSAPALAYQRLEGASPGILFLGGFRSDMTGSKALALESYCREKGRAFIRFDYRGHGASEGAFEDGAIGDWLEDSLCVLTRVAKGPQLLIGSSMGGWLALLLAILKPRRIAGLIGIAAAPDFTEHLIWEKLTPAQQERLRKEGKILVPSEYGEPYPITRRLIEDGREHMLLDADIPVYCPVRLIHGIKDADVPWEVSFSINEKLLTHDVRTILVENGDHRLSTPSDIGRLERVLEKMLDGIQKNQKR